MSRTTYTRQMVKLWQAVLRQITRDPQLAIVDKFLVLVCCFAHAYRCRKLRGLVAFGYDELPKRTFYGLRAQVRGCYPGVIMAFELMPANVHDTAVVDNLTEQLTGTLLGDHNDWSPKQLGHLQVQEITVLESYKSSRRQLYTYWLTNLRRRIETAIGQLVGRFRRRR